MGVGPGRVPGELSGSRELNLELKIQNDGVCLRTLYTANRAPLLEVYLKPPEQSRRNCYY